MKRILKRLGRFFVALKQKDEKDLRHSILLVDGSFILANNFALIIRGVQKKFKNAHLVVLTFPDKKEFIRDNFPDVEVIVPESKIKPKRYQLAIEFLLLLRRNFRYIILSSLDISLISISVIFARHLIFLHNRWLEWYRIRGRTLSDILRETKSADRNRRRINKGIKEIIKSCGRAFLILTALDKRDLKCRILIEDNGYTEINHIINAVRGARNIFINPDITLLTFTSRQEDFINNFPEIKLVTVKEQENRYKLAIQMYRMRKLNFHYVILTTLDISPIVVSFLFFRAKVLLYNRWHQWWSLSFRNIFGYFKEICIFLIMAPLVIYLLIASTLILIRTNLRITLSHLRSGLRR